MSKSNYSNDNRSSPFKKGRLKDVVKPKLRRHTRPLYTSDKDVVDALVIDIVQVLANIGIVIKNVHTIARALAKCGWIRQRKMVRDDTE